jgi:hypothetical protein
MSAPTDHTRALERLYARIGNAISGLGYLEFWEHGGRASASPEAIAQMEAELEETNREHAAARAAYDALVTKLRAEAPAELDAWALAHDHYIAQYLDAAAGEDEFRIQKVTLERAEWAELRAGTRDFVSPPSYVPLNEALYKRTFGIDPRTLEG